MPVINRIAEFHPEIVGWRHDFHQNPELLYDVHRTSARVADLLRSFGVDEVVTGLGRTGVVGLIHGRNGPGGRVVGLRADMDALPITERTGKAHASKVAGKMHACGHDGHTAMLLGAAKYLAETRNFAGTVAVIFQPAEEGGGGGKAMIADGLMDRFAIEEVYGLHNMPGHAAGTFAIKAGGIMAATDEFVIEVEGVGGHAAMPHMTTDPVLTAANIVVALQSIMGRNVDPMKNAVVSVTVIRSHGEASNVVPRSVTIKGTVRTLETDVQSMIERRIAQIATGVAEGFGAKATASYRRGYPVTVNHAAQAAFAAGVARDVAGAERVDDNTTGVMGGEDFSFMLNERPGAYIFLGNGQTSELHTDTYDFNDDIIPVGVSYWVRLAETALA